MQNSTAAAISSPLGEGGISVIRISGDNALLIADKVFSAVSGKLICDQKGYTALFGAVYDNGGKIDDAVALIFRAPHSYTGENVVEISVHGGMFVAKKTLRAVLAAGAEAAGPGEFTKRAYLNGKLDLTQAESVMGVISAGSETELKISSAALGGKISSEIAEIKENLVGLAASIAAFADYPDEDLPELSVESFGSTLKNIENKLGAMLSSYDAGRVLREGIITAIVGKPNVGKSTLMNLLSRTERSIVTSVAGTTRDVIEETVMAGEIMLRLADTAGIHETADEVEGVGVRLAKEKIEQSELILAVFDSGEEFSPEDAELLELIKNKKAIAVINKSDLEPKFNMARLGTMPKVFISAKTGVGKDNLTEKIAEVTGAAHLSADSVVLGSERQRNCAQKAYSSIKEAAAALRLGQTVDAVGVCIDDALYALYQLTGERATNTVTDELFNRFCVGK